MNLHYVFYRINVKKNENDCVRNPIICHDMENVIQEAINKDFYQADKMREDLI
jgi:hypothetical protein